MSTTSPEIGAEAVRILAYGAHQAVRKGPRTVDVAALLSLIARGAAPDSVLRRIAAAPLRTPAGLPAPSAPEAGGTGDAIGGTDAVSQLLREVAWRELTAWRAKPGPLRWDEPAASAVRAALDEAREAGVAYAGVIHLTAALLRDRADVAGVLRADPAWQESDRPHTPLIDDLDMTTELGEHRGLLGWFDRRYRHSMTGGSRYGGMAATHLLWQAMRTAVRLDDGPVTSAHLLLAVTELGTQQRLAGRQLRPALRPFNRAPDVLEAHGVTLDRALAARPAARSTDPVVPDARAKEITRAAWPSWTVEAAGAVDRAVDLARELGHAETGASHLTVAALGDDTAAHLLQALGQDPATVRADAMRDLSRTGTGP